MSKVAVMYLRRGTYLIHAQSTTIDGIGILWGHVTRAPIGTCAIDLGSMINTALNNSLSGVPHPLQGDWKDIPRPLFDAAAIQSWSAFVKGARCISIALESEGRVSLLPTRNLGARDGFVPLRDREVVLGDSDPETLGREAVRLLGETG